MGFELELLPLTERKPTMFFRCTVCQAKHDPPLPPAQTSTLTHCPHCGGTVTRVAHDTERPPAGQVVEGFELDEENTAPGDADDDDGLGDRLPRIPGEG